MRMMECPTAFEELYRAWFPSVVNVCRRCLGPEGDAEAIAQEALFRTWRSWSRFVPERPFGPWVITIARRLCINENEARQRNRERYDGATDLHEDHSERALDAEAVNGVLRSLPSRQRRVLHLRDIEGMTYNEIARIDGVTVEAVRGSLKRARAAFRDGYRAAAG